MQEEIFVSRAPGRLDVMGGIADYSGSLVLQVRFLFPFYIFLTYALEYFILVLCIDLLNAFVISYRIKLQTLSLYT